MKKASLNKYFMPALIAAIFILSRIYYIFIAEIRFNDSTAGSFIHILDPLWLKTELFKSIFYMHSQPPLFNFFVGFILKCGEYSRSIFMILYLLMGLAIPLLIYLILINFRVSKNVSASAAIIFILCPASILYENILFYTYPMIFMMCGLALCCQKLINGKNLIYCHLFFWLAAGICLTRSLFHIAWFVLIFLFAVFYKNYNISIKKILICALLPFIIVFSFYLKNYILFDRFTLSSWSGMNFAQIIIYGLTPDERKFLIENGVVSPVFEQAPFEFSHMQIDYSKFEKKGAAAVDKPSYSSGITNFNNTAFIKISENYMSDSIKALKYYPHVYLKGVFKAFCFYFLPAEEHFFHYDNLKRIENINKFWQHFIYGRIETQNWSQLYFDKYYFLNLKEMALNTAFFILTAYIIIILYSIMFTLHTNGNIWQDGEFYKQNRNMILFILVNIFYVTITGNIIEAGENNRFRFMIDPYYIILGGICIDRALNRLNSKGKKL